MYDTIHRVGETQTQDDTETITDGILELLTEYRSKSSLAKYCFGYQDGQTTPTQRIVKEILLHLKTLNENYPAFALLNITDVKRQCAQSDVRWADGTILSALDGIPMDIKDSMHIKLYPPALFSKYYHVKDQMSHRSAYDGATVMV